MIARAHCHMPDRPCGLCSLVHLVVARVAEGRVLGALQQCFCDVDVADVPTAVSTNPNAASSPTWAFTPKCPRLPSRPNTSPGRDRLQGSWSNSVLRSAWHPPSCRSTASCCMSVDHAQHVDLQVMASSRWRTAVWRPSRARGSLHHPGQRTPVQRHMGVAPLPSVGRSG